MATFTRNSTAFNQSGALVNTNLPRYGFTRLPAPRWTDLFDTDQIVAHYASGGDALATWSVSGGVLSATGGTQATLLRTGLTIADGEIIANVDQASNGGLIARYVDNNNYYLLALSDDSGANPLNNLRMLHRINGIFTELAVGTVVWPRGTPAQIRFRFNGSLLEAWFNNIRVIAVTDTTFTGGGVGMWQSHAEVTRFLDFAVHQVTPSIFLEEGVTNLFTANQASVETDLTGIMSHTGGTTLTRDTSVAWQGSASIRVVTDGAQNFQGIMSDVLIPVAHSQTYTFSAWVRGSGNIDLVIQEITAAGVLIASTHSSMSANSAWTRHSVTRTFGATGERIRVLILTNPAQAVTFWADGLQLEQRAYATSWQLGGTPRVAETLTVPTANVFNRGNWTIEGTYTPQIPMNVGGINKVLFDMRIDANNWYYFGVGWGGEWHFRIDSGGVIRFISSAVNAVIQGTPYHWQISGDGTTMRLCVNGVLIGAITYTEPVGTLPANMLVNTVSNGLLSSLRFSSRARTLAEHQATFATGQPLTADADTTYLLPLNNSLASTRVRVITAILRSTSALQAIWQAAIGQHLVQVINATTRTTSSIGIGVGKVISAPIRTTATIARHASKIISAPLRTLAAIVRAVTKPLSTTNRSATHISHNINKVLNNTLHITSTTTKHIFQTIWSHVQHLGHLSTSILQTIQQYIVILDTNFKNNAIVAKAIRVSISTDILFATVRQLTIAKSFMLANTSLSTIGRHTIKIIHIGIPMTTTIIRFINKVTNLPLRTLANAPKIIFKSLTRNIVLAVTDLKTTSKQLSSVIVCNVTPLSRILTKVITSIIRTPITLVNHIRKTITIELNQLATIAIQRMIILSSNIHTQVVITKNYAKLLMSNIKFDSQLHRDMVKILLASVISTHHISKLVTKTTHASISMVSFIRTILRESMPISIASLRGRLDRIIELGASWKKSKNTIDQPVDLKGQWDKDTNN